MKKHMEAQRYGRIIMAKNENTDDNRGKAVKKKNIVKICPIHSTRLLSRPTKYGQRYFCNVPGCTVAWWGGETSTPANQETRDCRAETHRLLDPLWKSKQYRKGWLYKKIAQSLVIPQEKAHIGMFNISQCLQVQAIARSLEKEAEPCESQ